MNRGRGAIAGILTAMALAVGIPVAVIATHNDLRASLATESGTEPRDALWAIECDAAKPPVCTVGQNVYVKTGQDSPPVFLLHVSLGHVHEDSNLRMAFTLPLGVVLTPGVALRIDDDAESRFTIDRCLPDGCKAALVVDGGGRAKLEASSLLHVTYVGADGQPIDAAIKLEGFGAALRQAGI